MQVTFLTPTSPPAASLGGGGGIVVRPASPAATPIPQVQVLTPTPSGPIRESYPLAQPLTPAQRVAPQTITVRDRDGTRRARTAVMGGQAAWAKALGLQKKPGGRPPGQSKRATGNGEK